MLSERAARGRLDDEGSAFHVPSPEPVEARGNGKEVGAEYQERCIESWHRAGFDPVSVNSERESYPHSVGMVSVGRDASAVTGRPNIFLADLLTVASQTAGGGPVVVMNADLLDPTGTPTSPQLSASFVPENSSLVDRINIDRLDADVGTALSQRIRRFWRSRR